MILGIPEWLVTLVGGAVLGFLFRQVEKRRQDNRERKTLVRALSAEIEGNAKVTETIEARYSGRDLRKMINDRDLPSLKNDTWRDFQGKAYLLPTGLGEVIQRYYARLQTLLTLLSFARDERLNEQINIALRKQYAESLPEQDEARNRLMRTDPYLEALEKTLAAQDEAQQRIKDYLNSDN